MPGKGPVNKPGSFGHDVFDNQKRIEVVNETVTVVIEEVDNKKVEELTTAFTDNTKFFRPKGDGTVEIASIPGGGGGGGESREIEVFAATNGQTIFSLSNTPIATTEVVMFVNGIAYTNGTDFTVLGTTLTWLDILFTLELGDEVQIDYHY